MVLIQSLCFGSNLLLIKFVAICVSSCSLLLHYLCLKMSPFMKSAVKGGSSKGNEPVIDLDRLSLSWRRLDLRLEFMTTLALDHMLHIKHIWITSRVPPCWWKGLLSKGLFSIWTFRNGLPLKIGTTFCPILKILMKSWWRNFMQMSSLMGMS